MFDDRLDGHDVSKLKAILILLEKEDSKHSHCRDLSLRSFLWTPVVIKTAIVGWEEGSAGLIHSWAASIGLDIRCFIHPHSQPPIVSRSNAMKGRKAKQFSIPENGQFKGLRLISSTDWPNEVKGLGISHVIVTLSDNMMRLAEIDRARQSGISLLSAIHPSVTILADAVLGENLIVHARAVIGYRAELQHGVIINTGAQVDHHCVVGAGCSIDPGVIMAGNVVIGEAAKVHTGAIIRNKVNIGVGAIVAAGAVVIEDVAADTTVMGIPARSKSVVKVQ